MSAVSRAFGSNFDTNLESCFSVEFLTDEQTALDTVQAANPHLKFIAVPDGYAVGLVSRSLLRSLYPDGLATLTYFKTFPSQVAFKRYHFSRQLTNGVVTTSPFYVLFRAGAILQEPSPASDSGEISQHTALPPSLQELAVSRAADLRSGAAEFGRLFSR